MPMWQRLRALWRNLARKQNVALVISVTIAANCAEHSKKGWYLAWTGRHISWNPTMKSAHGGMNQFYLGESWAAEGRSRSRREASITLQLVKIERGERNCVARSGRCQAVRAGMGPAVGGVWGTWFRNISAEGLRRRGQWNLLECCGLGPKHLLTAGHGIAD